MRITMDDLEMTYWDSALQFQIFDNEKGYIETSFTDKDNQEITFDVILQGNSDIVLFADIVVDLKANYELINRLCKKGDCSLVESSDKQYLQKFTDIDHVADDSLKFLQCLIVLDGIR